MISILKITKENNSAKKSRWSDRCLQVVWTCFIFLKIVCYYPKRYQSYRAEKIFILKITKGHNSAKNVSGGNAVNLCSSSGHALYLCQVS